MAIVKLHIDDVEVEIEEGKTVLEAAHHAGIYIPALCAHPDLPPAQGQKPESVIYLGGQPYESSDTHKEYQGCRLCIVEVEGMAEPQTSCTLPAADGMKVSTSTPAVQELRREHLKAILARHPHSCLTCSQREGCSPFESCPQSLPVQERCCSKLGYCELQPMCDFIGIKDDTPRYIHRGLPVKKDEPLFTQDYNFCIGCTRCVRACRDLRGVSALGFVSRDGEIIAGTIAPSLQESGCKFCGACVEVCPTGALLDLDIKRAERESALVPCTNACPAGINVPQYVRLISEGKYEDALAVIRQRVPFPGVLGRVCIHPCETVCRRGQLNEPIAICTLKRFAADQVSETQSAAKAEPTGKKAAIVGSGPAGLTAAYYLTKCGHCVTVFEALPEPGGMMRFGIPKYRLPRDVLDAEIGNIKDSGVEVRTEIQIDSLDTLWNEGFNAVFLAMGAQKSRSLGVEGESIPGISHGVEFLRQASGADSPPQVNDTVVVIGGGNVAVDVARTALRLGAKKVEMVALEQPHEMPALPEEIEATQEEGITIHHGWGPCRISGNGTIEKVELKRCTCVFDKDGRFCPTYDETDLFTLEADQIIVAIGQTPDVPDDFEVQIIGDGKVKVDSETLATNVKGVFAGGDVVSGPASVIEAIAAGRKAAASIDGYLGGSGDIDETPSKAEKANPWLGRDEGFTARGRAAVPCLPIASRTGEFSEVALGFNKAIAAEESGRCLQCDLRLQISPVILPPDEWLEFTPENVSAAPETDGVFRLLDECKEVIYIGSGQNIREGLEEIMESGDEWVEKARYLHFEETMMYTMRESELIQHFMQEHGRLPEGNDELF
ncbi:MAG: FAD-dependent oxidoreductase [Dehalococcoidia bacterium]|nr:MAG: FAD-dependent oxidoreductase [Dehalococcoidia bacterium]